MGKINNKGFFLVETIVVVVIVLVLLILLYRQLLTVFNSYQANSNYNTLNTIHASNNIKRFLAQDNFNALVTNLGSNQYLDITNYNLGYSIYFNNLKAMNNISKIYFTRYNLNILLNNINAYNLDASFVAYLKTLRITSNSPYSNRYRIIVITSDNLYGNVDVTV